MERTEIKKALSTAMSSSAFTKEFIGKWDVQKGSATKPEDARIIAKRFRDTGFYTMVKTMHFNGVSLTFWTAIKPKTTA